MKCFHRVIGSVPGQFDALGADLEVPAVSECLLRWGSRGVVITEQQVPGLLVPDADDVPAKQRRRAGVIGIVMGIDEVRHPVVRAVRGGDLVYRPLDIATQAGRRIEQDDAGARRQERALVRPVRDPVEIPSTRPT
jgi:hypothetical protein